MRAIGACLILSMTACATTAGEDEASKPTPPPERSRQAESRRLEKQCEAGDKNACSLISYAYERGGPVSPLSSEFVSDERPISQARVVRLTT